MQPLKRSAATNPSAAEVAEAVERAPAPRPAAAPLRVLFALAGLHRVDRGAEVAFESLAARLARRADVQPMLIGAGRERRGEPYAFRHAGAIGRERFERWPRLPVLRNEYAYEEATFALSLWRAYRPAEHDLTVTCSYPFTNWLLRSRRRHGRPAHVFVTQNGDWPPRREGSEFRHFACDGLVCTNLEYYERHRERWPCALIPNGVDPDVFRPGPRDRQAWGLPDDVPVVLMVSALIPSKRVLEGIRCVAALDGARLLVVGDGPLRASVDALGAELLGERFQRVVLPRARMPDAYRCADVLLHMSQDEPSAFAYVEALACGLPIVTHDRVVTRWTLETCGILVDTGVQQQVVQGLECALAVAGAGYVSTCRELVRRRFDWSRIADDYLAFFREVLARTG